MMINAVVKDERERGSPRCLRWGWAVKRREMVHTGINMDVKSTRESRAQKCVHGTWRMKGSAAGGVSRCQKMMKGSWQSYRRCLDERRV